MSTTTDSVARPTMGVASYTLLRLLAARHRRHSAPGDA